ncbi:hypothetical protein KSP40_PGU003813 [Platanthera guangdongensis]|uniref:VAN3-binding protein-like auxin canalisation domain-containing protein n=1 Tax=Platanthera guangdongensis TaxID=2320717 RepID=A0ABR2LXF6_9ASPA
MGTKEVCEEKLYFGNLYHGHTINLCLGPSLHFLPAPLLQCSTPPSCLHFQGSSKFFDLREKKEKESRTHNALLHVVVSTAGVAVTVVAMATEATSLSSGKDDYTAHTDLVVASVATLIAD